MKKKPLKLRNTASVIEDCVRRLRGAIMAGDLQPGQKLVEADLCQSLGVSRASLREALRVLKAERLVELVPNRGPSIAKLGLNEVEEIHDVWALLTGGTVQRFTELATRRDIAQLSALFSELKRTFANGNPLKQLDATNSFFGFISEKCGNEVLTDTITSLVSRIDFLRAQALVYEEWRRQWAQEIEEIVSAIRAKKPSLARRATLQHLRSACDAARKVAQMPKAALADKRSKRNVRPFEYGAPVDARHGLKPYSA